MSTENAGTNRLSAGEIGRLVFWLTENQDKIAGIGYTQTAKLADADLPFQVTEPNIRLLATADELPQFAAIHPKANEELLTRRIKQIESYLRDMRLTERLDACSKELTAAASTHANFQIKAEKLFRDFGNNLDSAIGEARNTAARHDKLAQCVSELVTVLAKDLDAKSWAAKWHQAELTAAELVAMDGGVCGND